MPFVDAIALATRAETPKVLSWCRFDYRLDRAGGRLTLPINKLAGSECPRVLVRERRCRPREHDHGECIAPDGRVFNPSEHCCRMSRRTSDQTLSSLGLEATTALLIASSDVLGGMAPQRDNPNAPDSAAARAPRSPPRAVARMSVVGRSLESRTVQHLLDSSVQGVQSRRLAKYCK